MTDSARYLAIMVCTGLQIWVVSSIQSVNWAGLYLAYLLCVLAMAVALVDLNAWLRTICLAIGGWFVPVLYVVLSGLLSARGRHYVIGSELLFLFPLVFMGWLHAPVTVWLVLGSAKPKRAPK